MASRLYPNLMVLYLFQWIIGRLLQSYLLKGTSTWEVKAKPLDSWSWSKLLKLRQLIRPHIRWKLGDETQILFWFDKWSSLGPLSQYCTRGLVCFPSIGARDPLSTILKEGQWEWPRCGGVVMLRPERSSA